MIFKRMDKNTGRYENWILPFLATGISALLMGVIFDFYYDLNDDTLMRDIMSGVYSGTPDGHNMQTLYPLGAAIALCYRLYRAFPWYGVFLFLCQFGCFFLVGVRLCTLTDTFAVWRQARKQGVSENGGAAAWRHLIGKLLCLLGLMLFQWGIWLTHMVNVQYTITCGMLVGTAVFLFLTVPDRLSSGEMIDGSSSKTFLCRSMPSLLLFLLAFQLRSEMAMLVLPFLGLAGVFCWWEDRPVFTGKNFKKYGVLLLLMFVGMGLLLGADRLAYGGEWRTFRQFFNDRTTIYDFYPEVVTDDAYAADLEELGVSPAVQMLLRNYNFGLEKQIDTQLLSETAAYAKVQVGGARDWSAVFREKILLYRYRSLHGGDAPYNVLVWLAYAANIIACAILCRRRAAASLDGTISEKAVHDAGKFRGKMKSACYREWFCRVVPFVLIFMVRSVFWMFILMWERDPERITHPLYLAEFCLLAGLFVRRLLCGAAVAVRQASGSAADAALWPVGFSAAQNLWRGAAAMVCLLSAASLIRTVPAVQTDQARRQEINRDWEAIDAYCRAHPDTFYFEDVYSTVAFSGKLLECRDNTLVNYDIAGGWMCRSPLYREKLAAFGIEDAADALADGRADFIMSDEEVSLRGLAWLEALFAEKGLSVYVGEYDRIGENYGVYQVETLMRDKRRGT